MIVIDKRIPRKYKKENAIAKTPLRFYFVSPSRCTSPRGTPLPPPRFKTSRSLLIDGYDFVYYNNVVLLSKQKHGFEKTVHNLVSHK